VTGSPSRQPVLADAIAPLERCAAWHLGPSVPRLGAPSLSPPRNLVNWRPGSTCAAKTRSSHRCEGHTLSAQGLFGFGGQGRSLQQPLRLSPQPPPPFSSLTTPFTAGAFFSSPVLGLSLHMVGGGVATVNLELGPSSPFYTLQSAHYDFVSPVPEPSTITLALVGFAGWVICRRKRKALSSPRPEG
jgi:hypothetical protein